MVEPYIAITLSIVALVYLTMVYKYDMQMMQQNSYRNSRFIKWLKMSNTMTSIPKLLDMVTLLMIIAFPYLWSYCVATVYLGSQFIDAIRTKYKKPLVFTKRVWRLYICTWLASLGVILGVGMVNLAFIPATIIAMGILSFAIVLFANKVLEPVEATINNGFVNDAKKLLKEMPQMKVVGITGSYGKTSTKHYLNRILSEKYNVLMTPGSFNTPMGVVRTVREHLQPYNDLFIVEMGAKNIGDIKEICDIVNPNMGIITAVGPQHLESFKSIDNVQKTKFELADALSKDGFVVVNNDFEYVENREVSNTNCMRYAVANTKNSDFRAENIKYSANGTSFTMIGNDGTSIDINTKLIGECNITNLMAAIIVAIKLDVPVAKIQYAVSKIEQVEHRLNMKRTPGGITIIDDAFNSNPDGSKMALDVLKLMTEGKRILITPGMIELGDKQEEYNKIFGKHIANSCDFAMIVGKYNRDAIIAGIKEGNMPEENYMIVDTFNEAQAHLQKIASRGDTVLYENDLPDTFK